VRRDPTAYLWFRCCHGSSTSTGILRSLMGPNRSPAMDEGPAGAGLLSFWGSVRWLGGNGWGNVAPSVVVVGSVVPEAQNVCV
jgi:hypothetical protein